MVLEENTLLHLIDDLKDNSKILQIGPAKETFEFKLKPNKYFNKVKGTSALSADNCSGNCFQCSYIYNCREGRAVLGEMLNYEKNCFDKVILHAGSELSTKHQLREASKVLKSDGEIVAFISDRIISSYYQLLGGCCFNSNDITSQINKNRWIIKSMTRVKVPKYGYLLRLVATIKS